MLRRLPLFTLFPYTTLFRSRPRQVDQRRRNVPHWPAGRSHDRQGADPGGPAAGTPTDLSVLRAVEIASQVWRSEEHTSELQSRPHLVCRLLLEKKNQSRWLR